MSPPAKRQRVTRASAAAAAAAEEQSPEPPPTTSPDVTEARSTKKSQKAKPTSKKRDAIAEPTSDTSSAPVTASPKEEEQETPAEVPAEAPVEPPAGPEESKPTEATPQPPIHAPEQQPSPKIDAAEQAKDRLARFKSLQARAKASSETNLKEATKEVQRLGSDTSQLSALHRKHAIASHKLLQADVEDAGEDFERKRAWDWTIDESEKWDRRIKKKTAHRDENTFRDYHQESNKVYKRQLRNIQPDLDKYEKQKMAAVEKAAASGGLDIVETENGELIAIDKDGTFYSTADSTNFAQNKPDKAAVDRLVQDLRRAEDQRLKKRKERMANNGDQGDVTYINEKNKQFNQKLARFYDRYTADIRDSFERGTMI